MQCMAQVQLGPTLTSITHVTSNTARDTLAKAIFVATNAGSCDGRRRHQERSCGAQGRSRGAQKRAIGQGGQAPAQEGVRTPTLSAVRSDRWHVDAPLSNRG